MKQSNTPTSPGPVLVGLFDDRDEAELAADELIHAGFDRHSVGFAIRGHDAVQGGMITDAEGTRDVKGAVGGATAGAVLGAGLGALAMAFLPDGGPEMTSAILTTSLGYGTAGAAIGGLVGAMRGLGLSENEAKKYDELFHCGKALVAVRPGARLEEASAIFKKHGGSDLHQETESSVPLTGTVDI